MTTPMESCLKLSKIDGKLLENATVFRQIVGSSFYITITRPDIAYSVGVIFQFMDQPCEGHLIAVKKILRYVKGTQCYGLMYKQLPFSLSGLVDADWASDVNDRCSATGFCFTTCFAIILRYRQKQVIMALSSYEAEYMAVTMATQECLWLKRLIQEMVSTSNHSILIYCDSESAIKVVANPVFHAGNGLHFQPFDSHLL
ncbi:secreted RxLR effector protein 161-like [Jatropha curcas]|uniref:secreted RxLR effector protein 161-like n=1 Tax=Jatropha curcas TaxID=180498 RepID=UPI0018931AE6|nr:secreted RxLR effector protein 161-like [Jatropha curcas]